MSAAEYRWEEVNVQQPKYNIDKWMYANLMFSPEIRDSLPIQTKTQGFFFFLNCTSCFSIIALPSSRLAGIWYPWCLSGCQKRARSCGIKNEWYGKPAVWDRRLDCGLRGCRVWSTCSEWRRMRYLMRTQRGGYLRILCSHKFFEWKSLSDNGAAFVF